MGRMGRPHACLSRVNNSELRHGEVRRISPLRGWVNKARMKGQSYYTLAPPTLSTLVGEAYTYP